MAQLSPKLQQLPPRPQQTTLHSPPTDKIGPPVCATDIDFDEVKSGRLMLTIEGPVLKKTLEVIFEQTWVLMS